MEEFGHGGRSRFATAGSASTRWRARLSGTCSSPSTPMRERMRSSASSTEITPVLYPLPPKTGGGGGSSARLTQEVLVLGEEALTAQGEEGEEAGGDQDLADPQREAYVLVEGREDDEDALHEDGDPAHEEDDHENLVTRGRTPRQPLEQVREGNEPAHDEDGPRDLPPRRIEEAAQEEARLDRDVAVPDDQVLREEEVHPEHAHGEGELGHVLDPRWRDLGHPAAVGADGEEGDEAEAGIHRGDDVVAAEETAVPHGVERHEEVEAPEGEHDHVEDEERGGELVPASDGLGGGCLRPALRENRLGEDTSDPVEDEAAHRDAERHERHVEPDSLLRQRMRHPRIEGGPPEEEDHEAHERHGEEARGGEGHPLHAGRPARLRHLHHAGQRGTRNGEARPEEQVDEVDAPGATRVGAQDAPQEGAGAEGGEDPEEARAAACALVHGGGGHHLAARVRR